MSGRCAGYTADGSRCKRKVTGKRKYCCPAHQKTKGWQTRRKTAKKKKASSSKKGWQTRRKIKVKKKYADETVVLNSMINLTTSIVEESREWVADRISDGYDLDGIVEAWVKSLWDASIVRSNVGPEYQEPVLRLALAELKGNKSLMDFLYMGM